MRRLRDGTAREVVAHVAQHLLAERDLALHREVAAQAGGIHRVAAALDALEEGDYTLAAWFRPGSVPPQRGKPENERVYALVAKHGPGAARFE